MIRTDRLVLRRWRDEDVDAMAAINADPEVMRWIGDGEAYDRETTETHMGIWRDYWNETGHGLFALEEIDSGEMVGFTGTMAARWMPGYEDRVEIGWRLRRDRWGRGYATEAARAALRHAFDDLRLDSVVSIIQEGNDASAAVARKIGMRLDVTIPHPVHDRRLWIYALSRT